MKIAIAAGACLAASFSATAQVAERKDGAFMSADFNYRATLERCALHRQGTGAAVVAKLFVRFQPDQRMAKADGIDIAVASSGDLPSVTANAIKTTGAGGSDRIAAQACSFEPAPRGTIPATDRRSADAATCAVSGGADGIEWTFTLPLATLAPDASAKTYVGHVTLIKRGEAPGAAKIVAACSSSGSVRTGYDLAVNKKV